MKLYKNLCLIALFWLLSVLTVFGSPIDSVLQASADKFAAFVKKNRSTNGNSFIFNFNPPVRDGLNPALSEYNNTSNVAGSVAPTSIYANSTTNYDALITTLTSFNATYDPNFEIYIFHGRYYLDTETIMVNNAETLINDSRDGNNAISESNKLKIFKGIYSIKAPNDFILNNLSQRVYNAISGISGKRILVIFAIEKQLLKFDTQEQANNPLIVAGTPTSTDLKKPYVHATVFWTNYNFNPTELAVLENIEKSTLKTTSSGNSYSTLQNPVPTYVNSSKDGALRAGLESAVTLVTEGLMFQKKRNQIFTACSALQIRNALFLNASPTIYKLLTVDERIRLLELMVISNDVGVAFQKMVLDIFENVPKSQIDTFLTRLEGLVTANPTACAGTTNNQTRTGAIIVNLMNYLDDEHFLIGNNNYTSLMTKIIKLIENSPTFEQKAYNLLNNADFVFKNIVWKPKTSSTQDIGTIVADNITLSSSGEVSYNLKELIRFNVTPSPASILYAPVWTPFGTTNTLKPFDLVMFTNAGNLNIINESMQGTMRAVPAIFLQYAKNKTNVELFKDGIITTTCVAIDILTIYKGAPAFTAAKGLRRAYIGFEVANATANLVLNLSGTELQGTQFANLVKYSDYIMLGIGVKDLVRVTGKSVFPALYAKAKDNVNQLNKQSIKYFLASYMRLRVEMTTLASVPANQSAKTVKIIYDTVEKELKATADGRAIFKEAEDLAKTTKSLSREGYIDDLFSDIKNETDFGGFRTLCINNPNISVSLVYDKLLWEQTTNRIRKIYNIGAKRNIATVEFDGKQYLVASSTSYSPQMISSLDFIPKAHIDNLGTGNRIFDYTMPTRNFDTELIALEYFAKEKNAVKGGIYPNVTGDLKITSDLCPCASCSDIFRQFSTMFPNLKISISTTSKLHY